MNFIGKAIVVFRRFFELLVFEVIASAAIALMADARVVEQINIFAIFVVAFFIAFLVINVRQTRHCYFDLNDKVWHYILNIIAYALFAGVAYLIYNYLPYEAYRMTMSLANVFKYVHVPCPIHVSAILFHTVTFITILLAPIGMDKLIETVIWEEGDEENE